MSAALVIAAAVFGALVGSFIATLVRRWPEDRSALSGRSACEACGRTLGPFELVPVISQLVQRGRCRGCGAAIAGEHLAIEASGAAVGALCFLLFAPIEAAALTAMGLLLLALGWMDARYLWLPDALIVLLAVGGVLLGGVATGVPLEDRLIGGTAGFAFLAGMRWLHQRLRGVEGMGAGDPKLLGAIGLWSGWALLPPILLVASGGLLIAALASGAHREDGREYPLGTGLAGAAFAVILASPMIL